MVDALYDVVVVGAGAAGIATAYALRTSGLTTAVFDSGHEVGGRTKSVAVGGLMVNTGAMFIYRNTRAEQLAVELGVRTSPFEPETYGIHVNGRTVVDRDNDALIDQLPLDESARGELRAFVAEAMAEYRRFTTGGSLAADADEIAGLSVEDRLTGRHPDVARIIRTAVQGGAVGKASQTSAKYGLRYFASYLAHEKNNRLLAIDGMQELPRRMADRLPTGTLNLGVTVTAIEERDGTYRVELAGPGPSAVEARQVVVAIPAPQVSALLPELPAWKHDALAKALTPGARTLAVVADVRAAPHLADWAFVTTVDRRFDAIINPSPGRPRLDPATGAQLVQFVCYGNGAGHQEGFGVDGRGVDEWVDDFLAVAPELRGHVVGVHGQTWPHCFSLLSPSRSDVLDDLRRPIGRIEFAGDYTSETAGTHGCYDEAARVAAAVTARVGAH